MCLAPTIRLCSTPAHEAVSLFVRCIMEKATDCHLLSKMNEPERTITLLAALAGLRIGEILGLRWGRVHLDQRTSRRSATKEYSVPRRARPLAGKCRSRLWLNWSGRGDLSSRPPAPKPAGLPLGSPSFSILVLKTKELEKYLVVARCTEVWLRMRRVPRILPIAKMRRSISERFRPNWKLTLSVRY